MIPDPIEPAPNSTQGVALRVLRRRNRHATLAAYTIIEVVVVMLVMGILAAVAAPTFFRSLQHQRLESAARRVKQDLDYLSDAARAKSATLACTFSNSGYTFDEETLLHLDRSEPYSVDFGIPPYELDSISASFEDGTTVSFDGYGSADLDGSVVLALGGDTRTVTLESDTGEVTISTP